MSQRGPVILEKVQYFAISPQQSLMYSFEEGEQPRQCHVMSCQTSFKHNDPWMTVETKTRCSVRQDTIMYLIFMYEV